MIAEVDAEGAGTIGFDDFLSLMTAKMGERDGREEIIKAFRYQPGLCCAVLTGRAAGRAPVRGAAASRRGAACRPHTLSPAPIPRCPDCLADCLTMMRRARSRLRT